MLKPAFFDSTDTIVALATPPGLGAIGVIRLSGEAAIKLCNQAFQGKDLEKAPTHTIHYGILKHQNQVIDEVLISIFRAPKSYTKENVVEISGHGSPYVLQKILGALLDLGARMAAPGEFTYRAFRNGRFDLVQAEAVADLIAADSAAAHRMAMHQLRGGFSGTLSELRIKLIDLASLLELELDFGEEDVTFADRQTLIETVNALISFVKPLLDSFEVGNALKNGVAVAIVGAPNVGKSTLLNALLNEEKAIVSELAGTTRDVIEDSMVYEGIRYRFIDTAGIRNSTDTIEQLGIERSKKMIAQADVILFVYDGNQSENQLQELHELVMQNTVPKIFIRNKSDLGISAALFENELPMTAKDKKGIDILLKQLHLLMQNAVRTDGAVTNLRHIQALNNTLEALYQAQQSLVLALSPDLIAHALRQCLHHIGLLTGEVTTDDILGNIFSKFCIGK